MAGGDLERGRDYCILRGETVAGETIDIRPIELTNALYSRTWTMVNATIANQSFRLALVHPENVELLGKAGGVENLPHRRSHADLLESWGAAFTTNACLVLRTQRLKAIRLDMYRWEGRSYSNYDMHRIVAQGRW